MTAAVAITGMGVIAPAGDSSEALHTALVHAADEPLRFVAPRLERLDGGEGLEVAGFTPEAYLGPRNLRPLDRPACLLASAARLALLDSGRDSAPSEEAEIGLVVGTMFSTVHTIAEFDRQAQRAGPCYASPMDFANTVLNAPAGQAAICHGLRGVNSTVAAGAASGLWALAHAVELIRTGRARALLAGGVEELSFESYCGFRRAGSLCGAARPRPFDARRAGFLLGEGAALLMLEDTEAAAARNARVLGYLRGHGECFDPLRGRQDEPAVAAARRAMALALADAGLGPHKVHCVSASARGEVVGDRREALALGEVFGGRAEGPAVTSIKAVAGEALGATGPLQVVAMIEAMRRGTVPGIPGLEQVEESCLRDKVSPRNRTREVRNGLVNSFGFDGHCCAVVVTAS